MPGYESCIDEIMRNRLGRPVIWLKTMLAHDSQTYMICSYHPERADDEQQKAIAVATIENALEICRTAGIALFDFDEIVTTGRQVFRQSSKSVKKFTDTVRAEGGLPLNIRDLASGRIVTVVVRPPEEGENQD